MEQFSLEQCPLGNSWKKLSRNVLPQFSPPWIKLSSTNLLREEALKGVVQGGPENDSRTFQVFLGINHNPKTNLLLANIQQKVPGACWLVVWPLIVVLN